jgi:hypothetical protein
MSPILPVASIRHRPHMSRNCSPSPVTGTRAPLLIHCWAGISRSMASAYTILCDRMGPGREIEIARAMRRRAPHAAPNSLLVAHADVALGRGGRMLAALNSMGPARMVEEGVLTDFPLQGL